MSSDIKFKRLIIITGASRGIGATLAIELNNKYQSKTLFILIARDIVRLEALKEELLQKQYETNFYHLIKIDFADEKYNVKDYKTELESVLKLEDLEELSELLVFYNHGTLTLTKVENLANEAKQSYQINVISVWKFLAAIRALFPINDNLKQYHINTSSKMASLVVPSWSLYSSTRLARASLFQFLASEQPSLRVLNYQPGPVYTDMLKDVCEFSKSDQNFVENYNKGKFLTCEVTVKKLLKVIEDDKFENGSTVDYYDYE